jgi:ketosteroid isomerase-like protein
MANRRMLLTTVIASLLLAITPFQAASADREEETLRVLVPKIVAAWGTLDISQVEPYYATDPDFAYFDIAPMKYNNWKEYREGVQKALFEPNRSIEAKIDDLRIHRRGSLAWATFTAALDIVSKQGASSHINARWTMVLEKRANGWIVVHEHVSAPLGGS